MSANRKEIVTDPTFVGDEWEIEDFLRWLREEKGSRNAKTEREIVPAVEGR